MNEDLMRALSPRLEGVLVTRVMTDSEGKPYWHKNEIKPTLAAARGSITHHAKMTSPYRTRQHFAIYDWDEESSCWVLLEYIPQGEHPDDFPWRKKNKR